MRGGFAAGPPGSPAGARRVARIVEVEAYGGEDDAASHARFGKTARNLVMYGPPGVAYVYLVYGMHDCLNVVTGPDGRPAAVLIRAVEPLEGAEAMRDARIRRSRGRAGRTAHERLARLAPERLAAGPGLVSAALDVTRADTGRDLLDAGAALRLESGAAPTKVAAGPRIGIAYAAEPWRSRPWRLWDPDSPSVSSR